MSLIDHTTGRPASTCPAASFVVSVSCDAVPMRSMIVEGATTTDATGTGMTVICAGCFGDTPAVLASMITFPNPTAVTTPPCVMVATVGSLLDQKIGRLLTGLPDALTGWALSVIVFPRMTDAESGVRTMSAT